jgi:hypothetical protein
VHAGTLRTPQGPRVVRVIATPTHGDAAIASAAWAELVLQLQLSESLKGYVVGALGYVEDEDGTVRRILEQSDGTLAHLMETGRLGVQEGARPTLCDSSS